MTRAIGFMSGLRVFAACMLLAPVAPIHAEPVVIYDSGNTRPITDHVSIPKINSIPKVDAIPSNLDPQSLFRNLFPLHTPELTPGAAHPRPVDLPQLPAPLFLIGTGERSRNWLRRYRERLIELGAVGLVVEARRLEDFVAMQKIGEGLDLAPASGSRLAKWLHLSHYPVLISRTLIEP